MRIAVPADVHGSLPALQAVLVALRARPEPLHWVSGNGERDIVRVLDRRRPARGGCFSPLSPPGWIAACFEHVAGRGPDPGPPARR